MDDNETAIAVTQNHCVISHLGLCEFLFSKTKISHSPEFTDWSGWIGRTVALQLSEFRRATQGASDR
jgi:hypothetical protein